MARPAARHPTELELEILKILWRQGPCTARQVREALAPTRDLAYTSVMTMMTIMADKGYLQRRRQGAGYTYRPAIREEATLRGMLRDLMDRAFDGSATALMLNLLGTARLDREEIKQIRQLIDRMSKEQDQ